MGVINFSSDVNTENEVVYSQDSNASYKKKKLTEDLINEKIDEIREKTVYLNDRQAILDERELILSKKEASLKERELTLSKKEASLDERERLLNEKGTFYGNFKRALAQVFEKWFK